MNTLIVLGCTGDRVCYMNVPRKEALKRYAEEENGYSEETLIKEQWIDEYEFNDKFYGYDIYGV